MAAVQGATTHNQGDASEKQHRQKRECNLKQLHEIAPWKQQAKKSDDHPNEYDALEQIGRPEGRHVRHRVSTVKEHGGILSPGSAYVNMQHARYSYSCTDVIR